MHRSLLARLLSESLDNFYMQDSQTDYLEDSRNAIPDSQFDISYTQSIDEEPSLSQGRNFYYEASDSQRSFSDCDRGKDFVKADVAEDVAFCDSQLGDSAGFFTQATEVLKGGTQLTARSGPRFPLHRRGYDINGRLPWEAPQHRGIMDEEPTQPCTQPYHDPRRYGTNSMLCEQDETDIIAILHPTSPSAHRAVSLTAKAASQHILQNHTLSQIQEEDDDELALSLNVDGSARDIALRFSSKVNDLRNGFYFGRNASNADIILSDKPVKTISSRQFRIFINHYGILMLEDTSTNGTIVDNTILHGSRSTGYTGDSQPRITLHQGAMIEIPTTKSLHGDSIRFVVNIPSRDVGQTKYNQNLTGYLQCINQAERRAVALEKAGANVADVIPVPTNTLPSGIREEVTQPNATTHVATTGGNTHGMHWNGGAKYNVVSFLGSGAMAMVFKLSSRRDGEVYACKQLDKKRFLKNGIVGNKIYNELNIMKRLRHPYIVACTDQHETDAHIFIIMELVPHGDLGAYTTAARLMPEHDAVVVARQMLDALEYLHHCGITHRDIKPENILVAAPFPWTFKLSDFGLAKVVKNDETFLKTFCGTLLYLAPEVYPGYTLVKSGKDPNAKRSRDAPPVEPRPYRHSVDIWSLGAVLYQLLAAKPAWSGTSANNGAEFLVTVMTIPVDYERLIMIGNSPAAANFLSRMLVLDPRGRARETELKKHPWLVPKTIPFDPNATIDQPVDLDASQLSLADKIVDRDDELEYEEGVEDTTADPRDAKRSRLAGWVGEEDEDLPDLYGNRPSYYAYGTNQSLPDMSGPPPPRLFGEIGSSALQSSGVLGHDANAALEVTMEETSDEEYAGASFQDRVVGVSEHASAGYPNLPHPTGDTTPLPAEGMTQQFLNYPSTFSGFTNFSGDPSLLGAEALVGQLNMASPTSAASLDSNAASPNTSISHGFPPALTSSKRSSQNVQLSGDESASKRSKTEQSSTPPHTERHSINLPADTRSSPSKSSGKTAIDDATLRKDDQATSAKPTHASEDSNSQPRDPTDQDRWPASTANGNGLIDDTTAGAKDKVSSQDSDTANKQDGQQTQGKNANQLHRAAAVTQHTSQQATTDAAPKTINTTSTNPNTTSTNRPPSVRAPLHPSIDLLPPPIPSDDGFIKPSLCKFGTLFPTRGSVKTIPKIRITKMGTTFGRAHTNNNIHPNALELRVPKHAFDLQLWYPGMEKDLEAGADWTMNPKLSCFISTRTSRYIKVNGVRLMKGKDCWLYGKLRSGDIISVFELAEGQKAKQKADEEYLRFSCEFNIGGSRAHRRGEDDKFVVLKEKQKFEWKARLSREGSMIGEASAQAGGSASAAATMRVGAQPSVSGAGETSAETEAAAVAAASTTTSTTTSTTAAGKQPAATSGS